MLNRRTFVAASAAVGLAGAVRAAEPIKLGLVLPMTGPFASTGREIDAACRLYLQTNPGTPIEIILRDDAGVADTTRRLVQELVVNDKVNVLGGFGLTPLALAAGPLATRGKVPMVVMAAATSVITDNIPFAVRTSQTVPQVAMPLAEWAFKNGVKKVVTLVSDYGPGLDAEKWFKEPFIKAGGQVPEALRVPLANPDFAPFLQRASDVAPDAVFIFVPSGVGAAFMKQFSERGLKNKGIKLIGLGDVVDDELLNSIGDVAVGTITSQHYSAAHESPENKAFVAAFEKATNGMRPNFMAVGGWDGMALIARAAGKAGAGAGGQALLDAMKGQEWTSPRGPILIDPATRDIVQNIYIRRTERVGGQFYNHEIATVPMVKDPAKTAG